MLEHHVTPAGLAPGNNYSHVVVGSGRIVVVAGQVALDAEGNVVGLDDPQAQAEQVFANLDRALAAAGASFKDVIKLNYYFTDARVRPFVREARDRRIDPACPPASTAVRVVELFRPEFMVEVEAWAVVEEQRP